MTDENGSLFIEPPDLTCTWCNEKCGGDLRFVDSAAERWRLKNPMHMECAIEALIDKKIEEAMK